MAMLKISETKYICASRVMGIDVDVPGTLFKKGEVYLTISGEPGERWELQGVEGTLAEWVLKVDSEKIHITADVGL